MAPAKSAAASAAKLKLAAATKAKSTTVTKKPAAKPTTKKAVDEEAPVSKTSTKSAAPKATAAEKKTVPKTTTKKTTTTTTKLSSKTATKTATKSAAKPQTKATAKKAENKTTASHPKKRKAEDESESEGEKPVASQKKPRIEKPKAQKPKVVINEVPNQRLNVYVFGEGSNGELGLGTAKNAIDVKRPRLNALLSAETVGVVHMVTGGMHCAALTHDNRILTWGVNDQGSLGRDTTWEGGLVDIDDNKSEASSGSGSDSGLNPRESTPTAIPSDAFPEGTVFVELAAGDSCTFALTDEGLVYGWGTFRSNDGVLGFDPHHNIQRTPIPVPDLKKIKHIVCGDNHVLALNEKGAVFAWGSGQQNQLGRRIVERTKLNGLIPREFGLPKGITNIGAGAYHSFAVHKNGKVYSWGLNSYGETGILDNAGDDNAVIFSPEVVKSLDDKTVTCIAGGAHHSIAVTAEGECLVWGRLDGYQTGLKLDSVPESSVKKDEDHGKARILAVPTAIPGIKASFAAAGSDHSIVITQEGQAYSWGFSANYQTGLGTYDDVEVATLIDNTAVRGKKLNWTGCGGQFSVLTGLARAD